MPVIVLLVDRLASGARAGTWAGNDSAGCVHPLSNLIATLQVRAGDLIRVDFDSVGVMFRMVEATAERPAADARTMIKIDCVKFQLANDSLKKVG